MKGEEMPKKTYRSLSTSSESYLKLSKVDDTNECLHPVDDRQ